MSTRVKICGLTSPEAARTAIAAGADAIGLVFADSPRRVNPERAAAIGEVVPALVSRVGVFVDAASDEVLDTARTAQLDTVQLVDLQQTTRPEQIRELQRAGLRVLKALRVRARDAQELVRQLAPYSAADALLLDSFVPGVAGGSGDTFAWELAAEAARRWPVILAGGLTSDNVEDALEAVRPFGVDVSSGVEAAPGQKDPAKVRSFIARVRRYDVDHPGN